MAQDTEPFELAHHCVVRVSMRKQWINELLSCLQDFWIKLASCLRGGFFAAHRFDVGFGNSLSPEAVKMTFSDFSADPQ